VRIAVTTYYTPEYGNIGRLTDQTKIDYCAKQGYDFKLKIGSHYSPATSWDRILHLMEVLAEGYDAAMLIDADAFIMNDDIEIESYLRTWPGKDLFVTTDINGLNSGVFIARNTPELRRFFYAVTHQGRTFYENHVWREQIAMIWFLASPPYDTLAQYLPQRQLQSYVTRCYDQPDPEISQYQPGDWIIHLPGVGNREEIIREYLAKR
jgi:hypothetical protein